MGHSLSVCRLNHSENLTCELRLTGSMEARTTPRVLPSWSRSGDCSVADNPHRQQSVARESVFHDCAASPVLFRSRPRSGQKSECMKSFFFFFRTLCYCTAQLSYGHVPSPSFGASQGVKSSSSFAFRHGHGDLRPAGPTRRAFFFPLRHCNARPSPVSVLTGIRDHGGRASTDRAFRRIKPR